VVVVARQPALRVPDLGAAPAPRPAAA
jgi:hypothetical protein